ncbi:MAG: glycosyltransferase [Fusobacteriaceae bacterium]
MLNEIKIDEMKKKKIIIISNYFVEVENSRPNLEYKYFKEEGYNVKMICSNFSHSKKIKQEYSDNQDYIILNVKEYKKNISLNRILSHILFAKDVVKKLSELEADLVYVNIPPNILGYYVTKYCKKNNIKVISDIIDLWPEAMPIPKILKKTLELTLGIIWKKLRTIAIKNSDFIITESQYFYDILGLKKYSNSKVILLKKSDKKDIQETKINIVAKEKDNQTIKIGYLGNIGKIYDFDGLIKICKMLKENKNVIVEIIGDGENKDYLIGELEKAKVQVKFHGIIYEEEKKREILESCDFGFNGYKESTEVALSYKSIDYFSYGLPIINSAKGDTWDMCEKYGVGVNYKEINQGLENKINQFYKNRKLILEFYNNNFSYNSLASEMTTILKEINL